MRDKELNDDNYIEVESFDIDIDGEKIEVEIDRDAELLWLRKECLSFQDAIWFHNIVINFDYKSEGFKPWNVPVFNRRMCRFEFIEMMEFFNIDK